MPQTENTCKLRSKCLKKDEHLDKCSNPECQNVIHPSCFNKLLVTFCRGWCFNSQEKVLEAAPRQTMAKEECHGILMSLHLNSTLWKWSSTGWLQINWSLGAHGWWWWQRRWIRWQQADWGGPPRVKHAVGDLPTLKKKLRTSPSSLSSDLTELSQLTRKQMPKNYKYQIMQFEIEERKIKLLEQESTIKMEKLKAEAVIAKRPFCNSLVCISANSAGSDGAKPKGSKPRSPGA